MIRQISVEPPNPPSPPKAPCLPAAPGGTAKARSARRRELERASLFLAVREETEPSPGFRARTWFSWRNGEGKTEFSPSAFLLRDLRVFAVQPVPAQAVWRLWR